MPKKPFCPPEKMPRKKNRRQAKIKLRRTNSAANIDGLLQSVFLQNIAPKNPDFVRRNMRQIKQANAADTFSDGEHTAKHCLN